MEEVWVWGRFQDRVGPLGRVQGRNDGWKDWKTGGPGSGRSDGGAAGPQVHEELPSEGRMSSPWPGGAAKTQGAQTVAGRVQGELSKDEDYEVLE